MNNMHFCILYFFSGTIRRFLEKHGDEFDSIILVMMGVDEVRVENFCCPK